MTVLRRKTTWYIRRMKKIITIFVYCLLMCKSYGQGKDTAISSASDSSNKGHNVALDIQPTVNLKRFSLYKRIHRATKIYKLDELQNGYDSLQIRIWFDYSAPVHDVIILNKTAGKWCGRLLTIKDSGSYTFYGSLMMPNTSKKLEPRSGWQAFSKKLFSLNITSLPGSSIGADGVLYFVEVGTKHKYRFYAYWSPEALPKESGDVRNMKSILELLESEFDFKRLSK